MTLRVLIVGADYGYANSVEETLTANWRVTIAGRLDYYPSALEFGRMVRETEPHVLLLALANFQQAAELHRLAVRIVPGMQTVGLLREHRAALPVDAIREGIHEFLEHPLSAPQVNSVFHRVSATLRENPPQPTETEHVFAFFPARPGLGASTVAVNTSAAMAEIPDLSVLLADFDLHNGVLRLLLNLQDGWSLSEAAVRTGVLDEGAWRQFVHRIGRLDVARSGKPLSELRLEPLQVASLLRFARRRYRVVCADLPGTLDPASMTVLRDSSRIFLVTTPEPLSLYMAREDMQMLDQLDLGGRVEVVLNRCSPKSGIEPEAVARTVGAPLAAVIPNDYRAVQQAIRTGQPMADSSAAGSAIRAFARTLLSIPPAEERPESRISIASLFGLRKSQAS